MQNFNFKSETRIIFGKDKENELASYVKSYGKKVLVHFGGTSLKKLGVIDRVTKSLDESAIEYVILEGVVPNPRLSVIHEGVKICKEENIDFILAIGGGSAIDSAKAIALGAKYDGDVWDFFTGAAEPIEAISVGTILTIPGAGSEMSQSSIVTNEDGDLKCGVDAECIVPVFSILNPEMCYTLPPYLLACGLADIMSHQFERYFTTTKDIILSDYLLEGAMKALVEIGPKLMKDPTNYNLCAEFMWLATVSHNGVLDVGRSSDWGSHRIEHEISALYDITHGAGMAIVFPAWMKYVKNENIDRFVQFASRVFGINDASLTKDQLATKGIEALENFFRSLGLKLTLSEAGVPTDKFEEMAKKAVGSNVTIGRFKEMTVNDVVEILKLTV